MRTYVYLHIDPLDKSEKYVGVTRNLKARLLQHMRDTFNNPDKNAWLQGLKAQGLEPEVKILEECATFEQARDREKYWIRYYVEHGACLLNVSDNPVAVKTISHPYVPMFKTHPHLREYRRKKRLTQSELASLAGVGIACIADCEAGRHIPHTSTMRKLADALGFPVDQVFELEELVPDAS